MEINIQIKFNEININEIINIIFKIMKIIFSKIYNEYNFKILMNYIFNNIE